MMKVLVVEGSKRERRQIVAALSQLDSVAVVGAVAEARAALQVLQDDAADLVVTGVALADGPGIELVTRAVSVTTAPIVVVGERASRQEWRRHLEAGADRFVDRELGLGELQQVVAALVEAAAWQRLRAVADRLSLLEDSLRGRLHTPSPPGVVDDLVEAVRRVVEDHGATIEVVKQPTRTVISVILPVA